MVNTKNIRKSICEIGKILYDRKLTDSSGGNISVRDGDRIYVSPRGAGYNHQWELEEDQIIITDLCRIPIIGSAEDVSREAATHYYIYQNFPDIHAVIHGHPINIMSFGAAHMEIPAVSEGTRAILGNQPITNVPEVLPGSKDQAEEVVKNFKKRRDIDPDCPLICSLPYHGTFAAGKTLNDAFCYTEVADNCAQILLKRDSVFKDNPNADFSIHKKFTKEDFKEIDKVKEICEPGYVYSDAFGNKTIYGSTEKISQDDSRNELVDKITKEILHKYRN